jgi:hypothetical protein
LVARSDEQRLLVDHRHVATWLDERVREVRTRFAPDDEGSLWLLFLSSDRGEVMVAAAFDGPVDLSDYQMVRNLRRVINAVPSPAVLLVIPRADGLPVAADKELWSELTAPPKTGTDLVDLLIVGTETYWSAVQAA